MKKKLSCAEAIRKIMAAEPKRQFTAKELRKLIRKETGVEHETASITARLREYKKPATLIKHNVYVYKWGR